MRPSKLQSFARDQRGATAALFALALPVLVGGAALGAEAGWWVLLERRVQSIADLAAHAAAVAERAGGDQAALEAAAERVAIGSGFDPARDTLSVLSPPLIGARAGEDGAVEVRIIRQEPRYLTKIYATEPVPIGARAVAAVEAGATACLLALSSSAPGAITVGGSTDVVLDGCDVASNSRASDSFLMAGGAAMLSTGCISTVGGASANAGLNLTDCSAIIEEAPPVPDPYRDIAEPEVTGTCASGSIGGGSPVTVQPVGLHASGEPSMRFCSGLTLRGTVTFEPGLYLIEGGTFQINANADVVGAGVTFFLGPGVDLRFNGSATFDLSAPESGPFSGLLFFGSRGATGISHQMNGTASSKMSGALYTPASAVTFTGNFTESSGGCTQVIASTATFSGNSTLRVDCSAAGTRPIRTRETVKLVE